MYGMLVAIKGNNITIQSVSLYESVRLAELAQDLYLWALTPWLLSDVTDSVDGQDSRGEREI